MDIFLENLEAIREQVFFMHCNEVYHGRGRNEFSYCLFYDTVTHEFTEPYITDSMNDTAVTTTQVIEGEEALYMLEQLEANPNYVRVWGHSHASGGVSPSAQDIRTINEDDQKVSFISNNSGDLNVLIKNGDDIYEIKKHTTNYAAVKPTITQPKNTTHRNSWESNSPYNDFVH